jgi:hypothetical protein
MAAREDSAKVRVQISDIHICRYVTIRLIPNPVQSCPVLSSPVQSAELRLLSESGVLLPCLDSTHFDRPVSNTGDLVAGIAPQFSANQLIGSHSSFTDPPSNNLS